jgi:hypothetical protein
VPGGDEVLEFDRSRAQEPVRRRLQYLVRTMQTDAYEVYDAPRRRQPTPGRIGCLTHARRYLYQAVRDGRFEIDNNLVDNAIRPTAVKRKRWLFLGRPRTHNNERVAEENRQHFFVLSDGDLKERLNAPRYIRWRRY